ncbi:hypothetical protein [Acinetobacter bereziniae]|uniref:hypothetical protein n=1 Tax=Acinetobacter bereziniae TaxID=106648 RepID=UPI001D0DA2F0|nr:hypothetical protein [Acinetobacter bereziniae]
MATTQIYAKPFEQLTVQTKLSNECTQDDSDIFTAQTYQLGSTKVGLKSYSCQTKKQNKEQYYSAYGLQFNSKKSVYFVDHSVDAIGYVGGKSEKVDANTIVFDNMYERGGDLIIVWMQDLQHIHHLKVHYMASDEGGVKLYSRNNQIYIQKIVLKELDGDKPIYKNVGNPITLKKIPNKGLVFSGGNLKLFQTTAD